MKRTLPDFPISRNVIFEKEKNAVDEILIHELLERLFLNCVVLDVFEYSKLYPKSIYNIGSNSFIDTLFFLKEDKENKYISFKNSERRNLIGFYDNKMEYSSEATTFYLSHKRFFNSKELSIFELNEYSAVSAVKEKNGRKKIKMIINSFLEKYRSSKFFDIRDEIKRVDVDFTYLE